jgi:hypothetical protein
MWVETSPRPQQAPIQEPYVPLCGGGFTGPAVPESPDPLVSYRWSNINPADDLQTYTLKPAAVWTDKPASFQDLATLTTDKPDATVRGTGDIRLDFGVESPAWVEFDSADCPGGVEMSISEHNEPREGKTKEPVRHGDTFRLELNTELFEGVRFAWIHVRSSARPWHITGIRAVCQVKPTNYEGAFSCSDPLVTRCWYMAAYGVKAALFKDYFGAILMDRGDRISWTGDAHTAQAAALAAFGNYEFIRRNLEHTAHDDNGIKSYALYWVLSLLDYYRYTGDAATLKKYLDVARAKLDAAYDEFGTNPPLGFYGWDERLGPGFELQAFPCPEAQIAYRMLSIRAWREFADAMHDLGRTDLEEKYRDEATAKLASVARHGPRWSEFGLHAAADAIDTGLLFPEQAAALYGRDFTDRVNRLSFSPFNEYFILQAMGRLGKWDDALGSVRDMWGGMIEYGGTNSFEDYRPLWNSVIEKNAPLPSNQCGIISLSHPWGGGVVKWLSEQILGIVPTAPGFTEFSVTPHLGTTLTSVSGAMPTPHGVIRALFDVKAGKARVSVPPGTLGTVGVPKAGRTIRRIEIDGDLAWDGQFHRVAGIGGAKESSEFVTFDEVRAGDYFMVVDYRGDGPSPARQPSPKFYAKVVRRDTGTKGDWGRAYGRDGYVLCGQGADGKDLQKLPTYVQSVTGVSLYSAGHLLDHAVWEPATSDRRALAPDPGNGLPRKAACSYNNDQTWSETILMASSKKVRVALYFLDWDRKGRRIAVEVFDAKTLDMIAPVEIVRDFEGGKYVVYEVDRSVKFRFDRVRGDNAVLSGIFFD